MKMYTTRKIHERAPAAQDAIQRKIAELTQRLAVMVAYAEKDAAIEHRRLDGTEWCTSAVPVFDWWCYDYRVRPAPRTVKILHKEGQPGIVYDPDALYADAWAKQGWMLVEYEEKIS